MSEDPKIEAFSVYEADEQEKRVKLERSFDTVAEVLAHCDKLEKPRAIRVADKYFSLDGFMATHVSAG